MRTYRINESRLEDIWMPIDPRYGSMMNLPGVLTWCHTNDLFETIRHVALTTETHSQGNLGYRMADLNEPLCVTNTDTFQISVGRHTHFSGKGTQTIIRAESN